MIDHPSPALATRRGFLSGLVGAIVSPAIVRAESLMPLNGAPLSRILQSPWEEWIVRWAERVAADEVFDRRGGRPNYATSPWNINDMLFTMRGIGGRHFGVYAPRAAYRLGQSIQVFRD